MPGHILHFSRRLFSVSRTLLLALCVSCVDVVFDQQVHIIDFGERLITIDFTIAGCLCTDTSTSEKTAGDSLVFGKFSRRQHEYFKRIMQLNAWFEHGDSTFVRRFFRNTRRVRFTPESKRIYKRGDRLHCVAQIGMAFKTDDERTRREVLRRIFEDVVFKDGEIFIVSDTDYVTEGNADRFFFTDRNTILQWDAQTDYFEVLRRMRNVDTLTLCCDRCFDNEGFLVEDKIPAYYLEHFTPDSILTRYKKERSRKARERRRRVRELIRKRAKRARTRVPEGRRP